MAKLNIGGLILAAGASKRLGFPKQLLQLEGQSLLKRVALMARAGGCEPIVVVSGAQHQAFVRELEDIEVSIIPNPDWEKGQSTSVQLGVRTLSDCDAILILVTDQVALTEEWLTAFIQYFKEHQPPILRSAYQSKGGGVPLIIRDEHFALVDRLEGDEGLRKVLKGSGLPIACFSFPGGELDVDYEEDLTRLSKLGFNLLRKN